MTEALLPLQAHAGDTPDGDPSAEEIDIAIIGGGPMGLTAALYAARARRRTVVWEGGVLGGQIASTSTVENYPGFPDGVDGFELAQAMHTQAERFGAETRYERVAALEPHGDRWLLTTETGTRVIAKAVIVSAGAEPNKLGVPGEAEYAGRGVSYCATCDAAFFADEEVAVVGGGDAALDEALFTARFASKVFVLHRRDRLRASALLQERARANERIEFVWNTVIDEVRGDERVRSLLLRDVTSGLQRELPVTGLFVFIGQTPNSQLVRGLVDLDAGGHATVNHWMETERPGLFVGGDVRADSSKQVVSAAGDGATAAIRADHFIATHFD
ncbi:MAG: thioredoxin-disulfide reductase [Chloroflexi bacterium]|nr:thioredoxin-disulfide reductase [Chloroflexota bacterium]MDA1003786.1 thioredoxin-disulfide reductase [Chloroflexota bacterium]